MPGHTQTLKKYVNSLEAQGRDNSLEAQGRDKQVINVNTQ